MTSGTGVSRRRPQESASPSSIGEGYENAPPRLEKVMRLKVEMLWNQVLDVEVECDKIGRSDDGCALYRLRSITLGRVGPLKVEDVISDKDMIGVTRIP